MKIKFLIRELGNILDVSDPIVADELHKFNNNIVINTNIIEETVQYVTSVDHTVLDLYLQTSDGKILGNGFLVEVFDSGSDGKLKKLYKDDLIHPIEQNILAEGFSNYFILETDIKK